MRLHVCLLSAASMLTAAVTAEQFDRAVIAMPASEGGSLISWRLLASDPPDAAFDIYDSGRPGSGPVVRLNESPITNATCFLHKAGTPGQTVYAVMASTPARKLSELHPLARQPVIPENPGALPYLRLKFQGNYPASKVAFADLDGDGALDFIVKQPNQTTDPGVWKKSTDTFKVEAYRSDGKFLWRHDLGWNIEQGIWYSPMVVYDFDGDGKAEVAVKTAPTVRSNCVMKIWHGPITSSLAAWPCSANRRVTCSIAATRRA